MGSETSAHPEFDMCGACARRIERQRICVEMRDSGQIFAAIGEALGITAAGAREIYLKSDRWRRNSEVGRALLGAKQS